MISAPTQDTRFRVSADLARELAATYGTPLYVIGETHFRTRIRQYLDAFRAVAPDVELAFASKANSTLALLAIAASEGCRIDVASEGELRAALRAGVLAAQCHMHGNNKSREELEFAIAEGIGQIVVDNFGEIELLAHLAEGREIPPLVLRLAPSVDPVTHAKISTGQADTKFGFNIADGSAERAMLQCLFYKLPLVGFHCHVGSQLLDPEAQRAGGELIASFAADMKAKHGFAATYLNVGGGLGVTYIAGDTPMNVEDYCRLVVESVKKALEGTGLHPTLAQEPGRALVAESGVTLYRVGVMKTVPTGKDSQRTYICVDGGLADNPRPALYGARYDVSVVGKEGETSSFTVSGRHCETDRLFEDIHLSSDVQIGDLLQVLCTGAYNASMSSNYNRYPRPASVLVREDGSHVLIQRRDSWEEMLAREIVPPGLGGKD